MLRGGGLLRIACFRRRAEFGASGRNARKREFVRGEAAAIGDADRFDDEAFFAQRLRDALPLELLVLRAPLLLEILPAGVVHVLRVLEQQLVEVQHFHGVRVRHVICLHEIQPN